TVRHLEGRPRTLRERIGLRDARQITLRIVPDTMKPAACVDHSIRFDQSVDDLVGTRVPDRRRAGDSIQSPHILPGLPANLAEESVVITHAVANCQLVDIPIRSRIPPRDRTGRGVHRSQAIARAIPDAPEIPTEINGRTIDGQGGHLTVHNRTPGSDL